MKALLISFAVALSAGSANAQPDCTITRDQYLALEEGMSVEQVKQILICEGRITSEMQGSGIASSDWQWTTFDPPGSVTVTFRDEKLALKSQWNLQ